MLKTCALRNSFSALQSYTADHEASAAPGESAHTHKPEVGPAFWMGPSPRHALVAAAQ